jgi:hypothetical protein
MAADAEVIAAKEDVAEELLSRPGVTGVGVGFREVGGKLTDETVIRVYVEAKRPPEDVPPSLLIPSEINGHRTDVIETTFSLAGSAAADTAPADADAGFPYDSRMRPLFPGLQIQRAGPATGTCGLFVRYQPPPHPPPSNGPRFPGPPMYTRSPSFPTAGSSASMGTTCCARWTSSGILGVRRGPTATT